MMEKIFSKTKPVTCNDTTKGHHLLGTGREVAPLKQLRCPSPGPAIGVELKESTHPSSIRSHQRGNVNTDTQLAGDHLAVHSRESRDYRFKPKNENPFLSTEVAKESSTNSPIENIKMPLKLESLQSKPPRSQFQCSYWTNINEKRFNCTICDLPFSRRRLRSHMIFHSDEESLTCSICDAQFSQMAYLKRHMVLHAREMPSQCNICNKVVKRSQRKRHLLTHTEERSFL